MANIDAKGKSLTLEYLWSASSKGRDGDQDLEFDGQGTSQITVIYPERGNSIFVTLKVKGFPEGCPSDASDAIIVDLAPEAAKLFDVQPGNVISNRDIEAALSLLNDHPNDALFILSGHISGKPSKSDPARKSEIIRLLTDAGLSRERIILQDVDSDRELIQLWTVPPGANPPKCDECELSVDAAKGQICPLISVLGPAGIVLPNDIGTFTGEVKGAPTNVEYYWTVSDGKIVSGQGTSSIKVRWPNERSFGNLTATLNIRGLAEGCTSSAKEVVPIIWDPGARIVETYGRVPIGQEFAKLRSVVNEYRKSPNDGIYILKWFPKMTTSANRRLKRVRDYLVKNRQLNKRQFVIITKEGPEETKIYLVPPGATPPSN